MNFSAVILSFFLFHYTLAVDTKCYRPNGEEASSRYKPCGSNRTTFNTCCDRPDLDSACLRNGLCSLYSGVIIQGTCTSQDWSGCQSVCPIEDSNGWIYVTKCEDNKYCCHSSRNYNCCNGGDIDTHLKYLGKHQWQL
ncbi:hypothetical protein BFJ66_g10716 [Fusarium oxysporum f. sp. cepae]|uniref:Uncharacterized protein n=1 Tax=Fusarium oxysporum f. sp. cepae TaxID=396571 RepID=A0A3L6MQG0_FUSOX|nr:hypothetical protein BFJ65_g18225 [Fusarium oxysporum f. sp. cepae]RKK39672.1 hypothetical protein BFJ67_g11315 [Fusarium oxysporum f. sp. cepae]RKK42025.1 hypothetical protein BFJ66_g10716 [Fusarium oxysporum f. sp. cepae]